MINREPPDDPRRNALDCALHRLSSEGSLIQLDISSLIHIFMPPNRPSRCSSSGIQGHRTTSCALLCTTSRAKWKEGKPWHCLNTEDAFTIACFLPMTPMQGESEREGDKDLSTAIGVKQEQGGEAGVLSGREREGGEDSGKM